MTAGKSGGREAIRVNIPAATGKEAHKSTRTRKLTVTVEIDYYHPTGDKCPVTIEGKKLAFSDFAAGWVMALGRVEGEVAEGMGANASDYQLG